MPEEGVDLTEKGKLLSSEELVQIAKIFVDEGSVCERMIYDCLHLQISLLMVQVNLCQKHLFLDQLTYHYF